MQLPEETIYELSILGGPEARKTLACVERDIQTITNWGREDSGACENRDLLLFNFHIAPNKYIGSYTLAPSDSLHRGTLPPVGRLQIC
jgi:hypothetical protein